MKVCELERLAVWADNLDPIQGFIYMEKNGITIRLKAPENLFPDNTPRYFQYTISWIDLIQQPEIRIEHVMEYTKAMIDKFVLDQGKKRPLIEPRENHARPL